MKPASFEFFDPQNLNEALGLLSQYGNDAKILAGGQSLMPMMNLRLARPKVIIDINRVADLAYIGSGAGTGLAVGALTRHRALERSPLVHEQNPLLAKTLPLIGHAHIRNRGTIGGSLVHADPAAELPALALLLDAGLVLRSLNGQRIVHARDFFESYMTTAIEPVEILVEIRFPAWLPRSGWAIQEVSRRAGDFAMVGVVALLTGNGNGSCEDARIALFGVGATPVRIEQAEVLLKGARLDNRIFPEAARIVSDVLDPDEDVHASAEYRKDVAGVLTRRALERAMYRLREANQV